MPQPLILQRESNDCFLLGARVQDASGKDVDLSTYKGKVLLIVNVASQWYEFICSRISRLPNLPTVVIVWPIAKGYQ